MGYNWERTQPPQTARLPDCQNPSQSKSKSNLILEGKVI